MKIYASSFPIVLSVELAGVEPASKQGNHMLSTCLFQPLVFVPWQDLDHQPRPYLLNLIMPSEPDTTIPDLPCAA